MALGKKRSIAATGVGIISSKGNAYNSKIANISTVSIQRGDLLQRGSAPYDNARSNLASMKGMYPG
jgi:hypothetical protein